MKHWCLCIICDAALAGEADPDAQSSGRKQRNLAFRVQERQYYECHRAHSKRVRPYKPEDETIHRQRKYPHRLDILIYTLVEEVELDMVSIIKQRAVRNGALTNHQRHMLQKKKQTNDLADEISDVELNCMIEPSEEDENAFLIKSFQLDGIQYTVIH